MAEAVKRKRLVKVVRYPPMEGKKLLGCFAVDKNNPLLLGVLNVLFAMEDSAAASAGHPDVSAEISKGHAMQAAGFLEAQETILDLVRDAGVIKGEG